MDPKNQLNQLDPKLKEAYERVMSTTVHLTTPTGTPGTPPTSSPSAASQPPMPTTPNIPPMQAETIAPMVGTPIMPPGTTPGAAMPPVIGAVPAPTSSPTIPPPPVPTPPQPSGAATGPVKVQFNTQITPQASPNTPLAHGMSAKKKGGVPPYLIIVAGVIFIAAYAFFWMKIFGLPIPFLGK